MWAGYNRRRAKDRAADAARRRARAVEKLAAYADSYQVPPPPKLSRKRHGFRVTVECLDDGTRSSFLAIRTPFGLTISPSTAGRRVAVTLREYKPVSAA